MLDKITAFIRKYNMLPGNSAVVCGFSGGADSTALLASLCMLREKMKLSSVEALHVNHCIRGDESDRDEEFCRTLCHKLNVKLIVIRCDVPRFAAENSLSLEEAARKLRYKAFDDNSHGKLIATAHNADDNLETAILNLARGSALKGLMGIPPKRGRIIRPMLAVTRREIEAFLHINNLSFVTDSTNLSDDYTRNKIRHKIVPLIAEINPSAISTFINSSDILREENDYIESEVNSAMLRCRHGNMLEGLGSFPPLIRKRCLSRLFAENNLSYNHDMLLRCDKILLNGGKVNLSGYTFFISDGIKAELKEILSNSHDLISTELKIGTNKIFENKTVTTEIMGISDASAKEDNVYLLDYDKLEAPIILRNRKFGDKIRLYGRGFTSSVKKIINEKIPPELRNELHFIEDSKGTVMAERIGIAERAAPTEKTVNVLKITVHSK